MMNEVTHADESAIRSGGETRWVASNEMMRERLKKVAALAEAALANQPHEYELCWAHLRLSLTKIETEMLTYTATKPDGAWHPLQIPEIGIEFKRYHSKDCEVFVCAWRNEHDSHVYEIRMRRVEDVWRATCSNDGRKLCSMSAPSRQLAYRFALGGMRQYLLRGHRKTLQSARAGQDGAKKEVAE